MIGQFHNLTVEAVLSVYLKRIVLKWNVSLIIIDVFLDKMSFSAIVIFIP